MMKRLMLWGMTLLALACGGEADEFEPEVGTAVQDVTYVPDYGFRDDLVDSNTRCIHNPPTNSHRCNLPPNKTMQTLVTGTGMTATTKAEAEGLVDGYIAQFAAELPSWSLSRITSGSAADVHISYGTVPGTNKNSIHNYTRVVVNGGTDLEDFGSTGTYRKYSTIACKIDRSKILNDFTAPQRPRVLAHAIHYCMHKGVGFGSGGGSTRSYGIVVTPDAFKSDSLSARVICMAETYNAAQNQIFPVCDPDNFIFCPCQGLSDN
jgi:hypothetical protein